MTRSSTLLTSKQSHTRVLLTICAALGLGIAIAAAAPQRTDVVEESAVAVAPLREIGKAFASVTKRVTPAVVFVEVEKQQATPARPGNLPPGADQETLKKFFGDRTPAPQAPQQPRFAHGHGSGFLVSADGYILTNNHVVSGAEVIKVRLVDGREFKAQLIGADQHTDVAIIKIDANDLPSLPMGDSDAIEVGEWVLAIGSPFGLPGTVTSGIVSAKGRNHVGIADYENFIQTDAAINPGNSGGPLVNLNGEVIGINTAIFSRTGGSLGIGFAIPNNMAQGIYQQLIDHGSVTRGFLGIVIQPVTAELAASFGVQNGEGILVADFAKDSPARRAGIQQGDIVVAMDGRPVTDIGAFRNRVATMAPGAEVTLRVLRDGTYENVTVSIGTLPTKTTSAAEKNSSLESLGFNVQPLNEQLAAQFGHEDSNGVIITQVVPSSRAAAVGLTPGMLIREVNRQPVQSVDDFHKFVKQGKQDEPVLLLVKHGGVSRYVALKMAD